MQECKYKYLLPVRRKWIQDGWSRDCTDGVITTKQNLGKLAEKIGVVEANKCWDRVSYLARVSVGIRPGSSPRFVTDAKKEAARNVAEKILQVIYENAGDEEGESA